MNTEVIHCALIGRSNNSSSGFPVSRFPACICAMKQFFGKDGALVFEIRLHDSSVDKVR